MIKIEIKKTRLFYLGFVEVILFYKSKISIST